MIAIESLEYGTLFEPSKPRISLVVWALWAQAGLLHLK
jgi:hypothetical protein